MRRRTSGDAPSDCRSARHCRKRPQKVCSSEHTDVDGGKTNWNPRDVRTGEQGGTDNTVTNQVVVAALRSLTSRVNVTTGLTHPSDKASAVQMFRILRKAGEAFDPDQVRAWAVRQGWDADDARDLGELGRRIQAGRAVQAGRGGDMWASDILKQWRAEAADEDG